ncbi:beta-galactosidase [Sinomonas mesophila]|uniref:beta-galactosidase n=1 Tax=Sinomonas mesophila TaxID=1531955 RepID=UPI000984D3FB|nr:beta-galactosidase [Sinomonas mesophila]
MAPVPPPLPARPPHASLATLRTFPAGIAFGGDYNPEQWPEDVQIEDIALMREAGVSLVSVGIFAWALLEPEEGSYDFAWLDAVVDRLAAAGIKAALAAPTAAPPAWLVRKHPEILPVTAEGTVLGQGSRRHCSPNAAAYREHALRITRALAERYRDHPALALWHVDNELGCHVSHFYGEEDAAAFRAWLERRYGTVEELNRAWATAFWSQHYASFDEVEPPRAAPAQLNPTQQLDFHRFSSWAFKDFYLALRAVLAEAAPGIPATTNFMATSATKLLDYFNWAPAMDVVANDHYLVAADPESEIELAFSADLTRGVAGGAPWMLMEHSTSAVNWQPRNRPKLPGQMLRNSLAHVARGADAVMFFQWRQSAAGAEKFHSAMVPHAGTDSRVWREVVALGGALRRLEEVVGSRVESRAAIVVDYEAWWAAELDSHPSQEVRYLDLVRALHRELWRRGITADLVHPSQRLEGYSLVLVPTLYLVHDDAAGRIAAAAEAGATVLVTYFSGIVDPDDRVRLGGYPGAFRELLGVRSEEFFPLLAGEALALDDGTSATLWAEDLRLEGATAVRKVDGGPLAGVPALTRREVGSGAAWYLATRPDAAGLASLVDALVAESGVAPAAWAGASDTAGAGARPVEPGLELVRRRGTDGTGWLFALNHTDRDLPLAATGTELLSGEAFGGIVAAGGAAVVREEPAPASPRTDAAQGEGGSLPA